MVKILSFSWCAWTHTTCALILIWLWRYINCLLTYFLVTPNCPLCCQQWTKDCHLFTTLGDNGGSTAKFSKSWVLVESSSGSIHILVDAEFQLKQCRINQGKPASQKRAQFLQLVRGISSILWLDRDWLDKSTKFFYGYLCTYLLKKIYAPKNPTILWG